MPTLGTDDLIKIKKMVYNIRVTVLLNQLSV